MLLKSSPEKPGIFAASLINKIFTLKAFQDALATEPTDTNETRIILVSMPTAAVDLPSAGLGILKSALMRRGYQCEVKYFNIAFAEFLGWDDYADTINDAAASDYVGEWIFSHLVFPNTRKKDLEYLTNVLLKADSRYFNARRIVKLINAKERASTFIEQCFDAINWTDYRFVGFTTTFQQVLASLSLARKIKSAHPDVKICLGGANVEGEMGQGLLEVCDDLDIIVSGEADITFPDIVAQIGLDGAPSATDSRDEDQPRRYHLGTPVHNLDRLPFTDVDDFLKQRRQYPQVFDNTRPLLLMETSRGCWWGEKHHCTFCGLNGLNASDRSKSSDRALDELLCLVDRYSKELPGEEHIVDVVVSDNILNMDYFNSFLPALANLDLPLKIHFEVKSNLKPWQLSLLRDAGGESIQPGIESLSTPLLRQMNKGCSAIQNIQLLKLAREQGIFVAWNMLYGFPGEDPDEYRAMAKLIPSLLHLDPPVSMHRIRVSRFSPYFESPDEYGIALKAPEIYKYLYDISEAQMSRIASFFDIQDPVGQPNELEAAIDIWRDATTDAELSVESTGDHLRITDTRPSAVQPRYDLSGTPAKIYNLCATIQTPLSLKHKLSAEGTANIPEILDHMSNLNLMAKEGSRYLSLAIRVPRPVHPNQTRRLIESVAR